jgi:hypothetical protein
LAHIIAANFATLEVAEPVQQQVESLVGKEQVCVFHLNASGQHGTYPIGGDQHADPGTKDAGSGAVGGAAVGAAVGVAVGAIATPLLGPLGVVAGGGAGAYVGSFVGAVQNMTEDQSKEQNQVALRPGGVMVSVCVEGTDHGGAVIDAMRDGGARVIEEANGTWQNGDWTDFDPVSRPSVVYLRPEL